MKITNGKKTIEVTEKAFRVFYSTLGYQEVVEKKTTRSTKSSDEK